LLAPASTTRGPIVAGGETRSPQQTVPIFSPCVGTVKCVQHRRSCSRKSMVQIISINFTEANRARGTCLARSIRVPIKP